MRVHVDATWHARPCGHARVPAWHGCDYYSYLLVILRVIVHISIHIMDLS